MWIGKNVARSFQDKFEVLSGLKEMIEDNVVTEFELICG
jgi:hypothetical protein